jgi:hypothetical protein
MALQIEHHTTIHTHGERGIKEHVQLSLSLSLSLIIIRKISLF